jgi:hypothetical protein
MNPSATSTPAPTVSSTSSLARSSKFRTFAVSFAVASPIFYLVCASSNLPLITYHPAVNRIDFGWALARSGEGPAMYWYGWIMSMVVFGATVGSLATMLPERLTRRIPLYLAWLIPILTIPLLAYSLREFWFR